jgi:hypothetical protein
MKCLTVINAEMLNFKLEVLQGLSVDLKIKGGSHIGNAIDHVPYSFARRSLAPLALQPRMGLLPQWDLRNHFDHRQPSP